MLRFFGPLVAPIVGLGFVLALAWGFISTPREAAIESAAHEFHREPKPVSFSFDGPTGQYDRRQLQRGFQVYSEVCAACHGENGKGAVKTKPAPTDLTDHKMHSMKDGEIYWVITNGIGKSMPGFKAQMSDTERWQIVLYVRQLAK